MKERPTKIVCTIGPACSSAEMLGKLVDAGMDVARLNFSHGSHDDHIASLKLLREVSAARGRHIAVVADLQ